MAIVSTSTNIHPGDTLRTDQPNSFVNFLAPYTKQTLFSFHQQFGLAIASHGIKNATRKDSIVLDIDMCVYVCDNIVTPFLLLFYYYVCYKNAKLLVLLDR